jgi:hypothetical protein
MLGNGKAIGVLCRHNIQMEVTMENSVYQARWILLPLLGCFIGMLGLGVLAAG